MKKALSLLICLVLALSCTSAALAAEVEGDGQTGMTLSTVVPDTHTVQVDYNRGGYVLVNGALCEDGSSVQVARHSQLDLSFIAQKGYVLQSVTVNGTDVTADVVYGTYSIASVTRDTLVTVTFRARTPDEQSQPVDVTGKVYRGDEILADGQLNLDFGSIQASTDKDGGYLLEDLEDGRHHLDISVDGSVIGSTEFVLQAADVPETTVETLADGTQIVRYPQGTEKVYLDFTVNDDGSITIRPGEVPEEPTVPPTTETPDTPDVPDTPDSPDVPDTGDSTIVPFVMLAAAGTAIVTAAARRKRDN